MNKKDLRVIKTKNNLYNTLIELMKEKQFEEIKVSDICSHALVNRSTFYAHYNDKYDLLEEYIKQLKENFTKELETNKHIENTKEYYMEMIKIFLNHVEDKKEIYKKLMINNRNSKAVRLPNSLRINVAPTINSTVIGRMVAIFCATRLPLKSSQKIFAYR